MFQMAAVERCHLPVGASLLAMDVNDDAGCLEKLIACIFIASKLAPTGFVRITDQTVLLHFQPVRA
ncbi:hypothetical protein DBR45_38765, partial [Pseudomonas sp. HMWF031]